MKKLYLILIAVFFAGCYYKKSPEMRLCSRLDWQSVLDIFPQNKQQIHDLANKSIVIMDEMLKSLQHHAGQKATFHNTVRLYDNAKFKFTMNQQILLTLSMLSSDPVVRMAANQAVVKLQKYQADKLVRSPILLHAFQDYAHDGNDDQSKTMSTRSFLQKSINHLEHEGANLSSHVGSNLTALSQEIAHLEGQFNVHIVHHNRSIVCSQDELLGVSQQFIDGLMHHRDQYTIPLTYDAFFAVLENCTDAATRQKMFLAFSQRAYPENLAILEKLMNKPNSHNYMETTEFSWV